MYKDRIAKDKGRAAGKQQRQAERTRGGEVRITAGDDARAGGSKVEWLWTLD